jgi:hypothetical protein
MRPTITLSVALALITSLTFGQNYQTVRSDEINYYSTQNFDYVLGVRIDNIELQGADSVFYSFKTIRENESLNENDPCKYYVGDSWMGNRVVIKPDGRNIFYNQFDEPITIETQAELGDEFIIYNYPSGDWIKGEVTSKLQLSIFGDLDSIKVIQMTSNIPLPFEDTKIIISENYGFIEFFAPYTFPEPYQGPASLNDDHDFPVGYNGNFRLIGVNHTGLTKPTIGDVYDYGIGDQIWTFGSVEQEQMLTETISHRNVMNKFQYGSDSIVYVVQDIDEVTVHNQYGEEQITNTGQAESIMFKHLDQWNTPFMPEEYDGIDGWTSLFINECHDIQEVIRKQGFSQTGDGICLTVDPYGENMMYTTINGVGWLDPSGNNITGDKIYDSELLFYQKVGEDDCGSPLVLGVESTPKAEMKLYPNPTDGDVTIQMNCGGDDLTVSLIDRTGKIVKMWSKQSGDEMYLDLEELSSGTYTIIVENEQLVTQQHLVKK